MTKMRTPYTAIWFDCAYHGRISFIDALYASMTDPQQSFYKSYFPQRHD